MLLRVKKDETVARSNTDRDYPKERSLEMC